MHLAAAVCRWGCWMFLLCEVSKWNANRFHSFLLQSFSVCIRGGHHSLCGFWGLGHRRELASQPLGR